MSEIDTNWDSFDAILEKRCIADTIASVKTYGWNHASQEFNRRLNEDTFASEEEKNIFIDLFFGQVLKHISFITNITEFWDVVSQWFHARKLESRNGHLSSNEKLTLIHFCVNLRQKLREFVLIVPYSEVGKLTDEHQRLLLTVWRMLFFEPFAAMNLYWNPTHPQEELINQCKRESYNGLVVASMFEPFSADDFNINSEQLITASIPFCYKALLVYWMVNTPYFNAEEKHRLKLMKSLALRKVYNKLSSTLNME